MTCSTLPPSVDAPVIPTGKFAIVAHDAGAANQIFAWLTAGDLDKSHAILALAGPALTLAREQDFALINKNIVEAVSESDWVLTGTGWQTDHEKSGMALAKQSNKHCISVLDHWVNYRPRFEYSVDTPDTPLVNELWVTDTYAKTIAEQEFSGIPVRLMIGRYLEQQVRDVSSFKESSFSDLSDRGPESEVLFLMEPVRADWPASAPEEYGDALKDQGGEFQAFEYFLRNLKSLNISGPAHITIRPHPSDPVGKYDSLVTETSEFSVTTESSQPLSEAISHAALVVGLNSYAMVVALEAGKQVYTALPPYAPRCVLPHDGIRYLY